VNVSDVRKEGITGSFSLQAARTKEIRST